MKRWSLYLVVFALILAACGGADESTAGNLSEPAAQTSTVAPGTTDEPDDTAAPAPDTTAPDDTEAPPADTTAPAGIEGDPAPDFTLALGNGGEFTLSAEEHPVYMVFWAEW